MVCVKDTATWPKLTLVSRITQRVHGCQGQYAADQLAIHLGAARAG